ncbi:tyrosine-type recombinase/integrase [Streptomyces tendae]|uniref:tyrosine-type recombinase/integrase n=1 Tax=Streptomyces tendae TaxID=1932 RepID=UPI0037A9252D
MVDLPAIPQATFIEPAGTTKIRLRGNPPASSPAALLELLHNAGAQLAVINATRSWIGKRPSEHSRTAYAKDASWWLAFCAAAGVDPTRARPTDADDYETALREIDLAKSTRARRLAAVSSWYTYLIRADVADRNPFEGMDRPSVSADTSSTRGLTADQLARILKQARNYESARTYALLALLTFTGARIGSLLSAPVQAIGHDEGHRVIDLVTKRDRKMRVVLVPVAVEAVERYLAERGEVSPGQLLFTTSTGKPMDEAAVLRLVRRVTAAAGIEQADKVSPHSFRHSYATTLFSKGVPLADVQDAMGHADPRTTRRYDRAAGALHRSPSYKMQDEITAAMRAVEDD